MRAATLWTLVTAVALAAGCEQQQHREDVPQMDMAELEAPPVEMPPPPVVEEEAPAMVEPVAVPTAEVQEGEQTYTMKPGDTLYSLARRYYGDGKLWAKIFEANKDKIRDVTDIPIGTVLVIPPK
jgi:nucleoid-associated protein YgaU